MSAENVEIVKASFEAWNRGGVDAVISGGFWSREIIWDASQSGIPGLGVYRGYDEVESLFADDWFLAFPFEEWEIEVEELIDNGNRVIAMSRQRRRGATSWVGAELEIAQIFTLREGKVVHIEVYLDRQKALEAAGLSE